MRINEILAESPQLDEGPIGQAIGRGVKSVAGGIGAVAGGIAGIPSAIKQGFKAGKQVVGGTPATAPTSTPTTTPRTNRTAPANIRSRATPTQNTQQPSANVASRVGVPAGKQAVDNAVSTIKTVRSDRRPEVINYAKQQIDTVAKQQPAATPTAKAKPQSSYNRLTTAAGI